MQNTQNVEEGMNYWNKMNQDREVTHITNGSSKQALVYLVGAARKSTAFTSLSLSSCIPCSKTGRNKYLFPC